jgi:hypothetical protein
MTASKCVHKSCGKVFTDPNEECIYHPGPPVFHEGQKGAFKSPNAEQSISLFYHMELEGADIRFVY